MKYQTLFWILVSALSTVIANLSLRASLLRQSKSFGSISVRYFLLLLTQPLFVLGLIFYALSAVVWIKVISTPQNELTSSYPILVGLTFVLVTLGAVFFFEERATWLKVVGIIVILSGIVIVSRA